MRSTVVLAGVPVAVTALGRAIGRDAGKSGAARPNREETNRENSAVCFGAGRNNNAEEDCTGWLGTTRDRSIRPVASGTLTRIRSAARVSSDIRSGVDGSGLVMSLPA